MTFEHPLRQVWLPLLWLILAGTVVTLSAIFLSWEATLVMFGLWWSENVLKRFCA